MKNNSSQFTHSQSGAKSSSSSNVQSNVHMQTLLTGKI